MAQTIEQSIASRASAALLVALALTAAHASDDAISFQLNSWGKPIVQWRIEPDGRIRYTTSEGTGSGRFNDYRLVTRETPPSPPRYRWLAKLLKPARIPAARNSPMSCPRITDLPYGSVLWRARDRFSFDAGQLCTEAAKQAMRLVDLATDQVTRWAKDAPVVETQDHIAPN